MAAVYRGWLLRAEEYLTFEASLCGPAHATIEKLTSSPVGTQSLYRLHRNRYGRVARRPTNFGHVAKQLGAGPAVLRDYSKSMKHYWREAAFIRDVSDLDAAWKIAARFLELREDSFTGGFVLRRFESLRADEVRTWWVHGVCVLTTAHPDSASGDVPSGIDLTAVALRVAELSLPFVTVDLALRDDGVWRVMEVGDGQVSDRSRTTPAEAFIRACALPR